MANYGQHWLGMEEKLPGTKLPKIFPVNWFRKDADGRLLWPGYGQNMRVMRWIVQRVQGRANAAESAFGWVFRYEDIVWKGLDYDKKTFADLTSVSRTAVLAETGDLEGYFKSFGSRLPAALEQERVAFEDRVMAML
jgi:phosphoenolpyruvate carboxykinase (GTP)